MDRVPPEVWEQIFSRLGPEDALSPSQLLDLQTSNRSLRAADSFWRTYSPPMARGDHGSLREAFVDRGHRRTAAGNAYVLGRLGKVDMPDEALLLPEVQGRDPDADARRACTLGRLDGACSAVREDRRFAERATQIDPAAMQFLSSRLTNDPCLMASWTAKHHRLLAYLPAAASVLPRWVVDQLGALKTREQLFFLVCQDERVYSSYVWNALAPAPARPPFADCALDKGLFWAAIRSLHFRFFGEARGGFFPRLSALSPEEIVWRSDAGGEVVTNVLDDVRKTYTDFCGERGAAFAVERIAWFRARLVQFVSQAHPQLRQCFASTVQGREMVLQSRADDRVYCSRVR